MSGENYTNTAAVGSTSAPVGPSDTTATIASLTGFPAQPYYAEFERGTANAEIVRITNVAGSVVTMTRGQDGTSATTHGAGVAFEHIVPATFFNTLEQHKNATGAHGVTGNVVGTSGAQTVQDKLFRGALRSNHTDALPTGITASVETVADSNAARDGHVHRNTAGDSNKRGYLLQQSGTDRWQVYNDGTMDLAPGTSARPGFRNHGTTTLDGALTANGGIGTTGVTVTVSGLTVSAGGTNITGNATLNNDLSVAGNATVTGTATAKTLNTPVPIVGDTADRVAINTRTGANPLTVKNEAAVSLAVLDSAGLLNTLGGLSTLSSVNATTALTAWGGSPAILSVSSTAAVTTPVTGQVVYDRSSASWKIRTATPAWVDIRPGPASDTQDTLGTLTSTTYVETLTSGVACAVAFTAPQSGSVLVYNSAFVDNNSTARTYCSWIIRNGATIGSGTTFLDGGDSKALTNLDTFDNASTRVALVTGLTAAASYNIRQQYKISTGGPTGSVAFKELTVVAV